VRVWTNIGGSLGPKQIPWTNSYWWSCRAIIGGPHHVVDGESILSWEHSVRYNGTWAFVPTIWLTVPTFNVLWGYSLGLSFTAHKSDVSTSGHKISVCEDSADGLRNGIHILLDRQQTVGLVLFGYGSGR
jgi:hypothetical protein